MLVSKPIFCACCQTLITAPQFHNGKAYGYTCITKVVPSFKRKRDNGLWVGAEVTHERVRGFYVKSTAIINGYKFTDESMLNRKHFAETGEVIPAYNSSIQNGMLKVAECKNGSSNVWRSLEVVTERDSKGKLFPVKLLKRLKSGEDIELATF